MKCLSTFAIASGVLLAYTEAINLHRRTDGPLRVVGFPIQRKSVLDPVARDRLRKRSTIQVTLDNEETLYFANATLGTPAQSVRLHIDTGSSDLWVNTPNSTLCSAKGDPCSDAGTYSANSSSTYAYLASNFNITYVDGSGASGDYVTDTFTINGITLTKLQFGIGYTSSSYEGILGIGYEINEVQAARAGLSTYENLPAQMVSDGLINSNAYSIWLNDLDANTGSILFGGVDTAKYTGSLETLPIQTEDGYYAELIITLTGISFGSTVIAENETTAVLLDTGSSLTYLPDAMTEAIYKQVSAEYDSTSGAAYVPCSLAKNATTLDFTFSTPTISVTMQELVIPVYSNNGKQLEFADGVTACLFGIAPAGDSTSVLGDTFIRSAYLVYDLDNNEISMAQTDFNATDSNVQEITTGTAAVPDATLIANAATATGSSAEAQITGSVALGVPIATSSASSAAQVTAPSVGLGAIAALGVGIAYAAM
ncbi:hypothetical protein B7494_g1229 [Chlorociboria aeruginascens]|nr:hypothetical protein B7494_g1229 [Chlorociboria aeruginascens]